MKYYSIGLKYTLFVISFFFCTNLFSQIPTGTDIFLSVCKYEKGNLTILTPLDITHSEGYDNQPYFSDDGLFIFYTAIRQDKQADIYYYDEYEN